MQVRSSIRPAAELTYPHPEGWIVNGKSDVTSFGKLNVKVLTAIFRSSWEEAPTCRTSWPKYLGLKVEVPWLQIANLIHSPVTTNRDVHSWFKCILHRGMMVRRIKPRDGNQNCRLCDTQIETVEHFAECEALTSTFKPFIDMMSHLAPNLLIDRACLILGCTRGDPHLIPLPPGSFSLLLTLWKFIIFELTNLDTLGTNYTNERVWRLTCTRIKERINALEFSFRRRLGDAESKGTPAPNPNKLNQRLAPLAQLDSTGTLYTDPHFKHLLDQFIPGKDPIPNQVCKCSTPLFTPINFVKAKS